MIKRLLKPVLEYKEVHCPLCELVQWDEDGETKYKYKHRSNIQTTDVTIQGIVCRRGGKNET